MIFNWINLFKMSHISIWGSILAWILFLTVYSYAWPTFDVGIEMTRMV